MARRGAGEGSIYKRADGRWVGAVHLGYDDGRRRRRVVYGKTRRDVQESMTRALRDHQAGLQVQTDGRETVQHYLERWLDATRPSVRPSTHARYANILRTHAIPALGRTPLTRLSAPQVQAMLNAELQAGLAPRTVHHLRAVLRRALGQAVRWGLVPVNVAALTDPPRVPRVEPRWLTPEEARRFLEAARNDRLYALYAVALAVGLRSGEALGLRWSDVNLDDGTLSVRHALQRVDGRLVLVEPKTPRSRRTLALPATAQLALRGHRARQDAERQLAGSRWQEHDLVFTSTIGTPLDGTAVTKRFQRLLASAGLPHQRLHDLRHACASLLLAQGVHPRVVMELLGHSQIGLTLNTYSHVLPQLGRDAADRMEAVLAGGAR
jgi:integrase